MRLGKLSPEAPSVLRLRALRDGGVWASLLPELVSLKLVLLKACFSSSADHLASSFKQLSTPQVTVPPL